MSIVRGEGIDAGAAAVVSTGPDAGAGLPKIRPSHDALGDALPRFAWARLGTSRLRHAGVVRSLSFSPDGALLATAGDDAAVRLWSSGTWQAVRVLTKHAGPVRALAFSPDGKHLASGGADRRTIVWNVATGAVVRELVGHKTAVVSVGFSGDGKRLMSASSDLVQVVDAASGKRIAAYAPGSARSHSFALFRSGRFVISARDKWAPGGHLDIWRVGNARAYSLSGNKAWPRAVAVSAAGWKYAQLVRLQDARFPEVVLGYRVRVRDAKTNAVRRVMTQRHRRGDPHTVVFSPDGSRLIVARTGRLDVWDAGSGRRLRSIKVPLVGVSSMSVAPDNTTVAVASDRHHSVLFYDLKSGAAKDGPAGNPGPIVSLDVTGRAHKVVVAHGDVESAAEWVVGTSKLANTFRGLVIGVRRGARSVSYLAGENMAVSAHDNCLMQVWQTQTGRLVERVGCRPKGASPRLSPSPTRKQILVHGTSNVFRNGYGITRATGPAPAGLRADSASRFAILDRRGTVSIFDAKTKQPLQTITDGSSPTRSLALSRDGQMLALGGTDGRITLWRVAGKQAARLSGHIGAVLSLRFSRDGRLLFSGGSDTTVLVWDTVAAATK